MFLEVKSPTNRIVIHRKVITVDQSSIEIVDSDNGDVIAFDGDAIVVRDAPFEWLEIPLQQTLEARQHVRVRMRFEGPIRNDLNGIYYSSYETDEGETR